MLEVNEIFCSIQGEGPRIGIPSIFCRFQGCSFGCPHCDTKQSWKSGGNQENLISPEDLAEQITKLANKHHCSNLVLTGGEPTEQDEVDLTNMIASLLRIKHITLETAGFVLPIPVNLLSHIHLLSLSPKLSGFHKARQYVKIAGEYAEWAVNYHLCTVLKFVVNHNPFSELEEIASLLEGLEDSGYIQIVLQPNGYDQNRPLARSVMLDRLDFLTQALLKPNPLSDLQQQGVVVQVLPQLHRLLWGIKKGA